MIKMVLKVNGFESFLALKGIRYEDKSEFFTSLEETVEDLSHLDEDNELRISFQEELKKGNQNFTGFKLKPGHKNFIMNLAIEIEKIDVEEFNAKGTSPLKKMQRSSPIIVRKVPNSNNQNAIIQRIQNTFKETKPIVLKREHGYSKDDEIITEEYLEEYPQEYNTEFIMANLIEDDYSTPPPIKKNTYMYTEEFLATAGSGRRRRNKNGKTYTDDEEGRRERFKDLVKQSLECIVPEEIRNEYDLENITVETESEWAYAVFCPICASRIRLQIVKEKEGRFHNYKRSNFERHLRYKHSGMQVIKNEPNITLKDCQEVLLEDNSEPGCHEMLVEETTEQDEATELEAAEQEDQNTEDGENTEDGDDILGH